MTYRTKEMEKLTGASHYIRELRYNEAFRQVTGVILIAAYSIIAKPSIYLIYFACVFVCLGTLVRLYASGFIFKNKELAVIGPYSYVRHPLYTGNILISFGMSLASGFLWPILIVLIFYWFSYIPAVEYEDGKLKSLFTDAWDSWASQTPAIIPRFKYKHFYFDRWSFKRSMNNGEPFIFSFVLICLLAIIVR